jgi:ribosomal protein L11 methylase PrmA
MSSLNKKQGKFDNPFEASSFIRYATIKSKDELEDYYSRNKSKLPPILQSRNIFIQHLNKANPVKTDRMAELTKEHHYHPT